MLSRRDRPGRTNNVVEIEHRSRRGLSVHDFCANLRRAIGRPTRVFPIFKSWTVPLAVGAAYYIAAEVGGALAFPSAPVSVFWAPNAILMAALLLAPREQWWMYFAAIVPFHFFAQLLDSPLAQVDHPVLRQHRTRLARRARNPDHFSDTPSLRSDPQRIDPGVVWRPARPCRHQRPHGGGLPACSGFRTKCGSPSWPGPSPTPSRW